MLTVDLSNTLPNIPQAKGFLRLLTPEVFVITIPLNSICYSSTEYHRLVGDYADITNENRA